MFKRIVTVALAFVGLSVGAGFASGQEVLQFFVHFGVGGLIGAVVVALLMGWAGGILLQLGSFHQPSNHNVVFQRSFSPIPARLLDIAVIATVFSLSTVMFAGGGSNLNQMWGLPTWVGSVLLLVLVLIAGNAPSERISSVIAWTTPLMVILIIVAFVYSVWTFSSDATTSLDSLNAAAASTSSTLPNVVIAVISYLGFSMIVIVSMGLVIGGEFINTRVAGIGGVAGGLLFGILLVMVAFTIYVTVGDVGMDQFPMLSSVTIVSGAAGTLMSIAIYAMIFNSALGMTYAFTCRFVEDRTSMRFHVVYSVTAVVAFGLSFWGFSNIVGHVFPVLGYIGAVLFLLLSVEYLRRRTQIKWVSNFRVRRSWPLRKGQKGGSDNTSGAADKNSATGTSSAADKAE